MDQITGRSRLSIFPTNKRATAPKFDIDASLSTRREQILALIDKQIDNFEEMEKEDVLQEREFEEKFNRLLQSHRDKLRSLSNDEEKRKLVCEIKDRVKKANEECLQERENNENIKGRIDRLDEMLSELKESKQEEEAYKKKKAELNL